MFVRMRPDLERTFGVDWVYELDLLFAGRPGPSLRNELSHGHLSAAACFHPNFVYGCWMMYRLCMVPLLPQWDQIATDLQAAE